MGEKEKIAKEVESSCACLEVRYRPLDNEDGSLRESWECKHCGANFIRKRRHIAEIKQAKKDAVIETLNAILSAFKSNDLAYGKLPCEYIEKLLKQAQEKG